MENAEEYISQCPTIFNYFTTKEGMILFKDFIVSLFDDSMFEIGIRITKILFLTPDFLGFLNKAVKPALDKFILNNVDLLDYKYIIKKILNGWKCNIE